MHFVCQLDRLPKQGYLAKPLIILLAASPHLLNSENVILWFLVRSIDFLYLKSVLWSKETADGGSERVAAGG